VEKKGGETCGPGSLGDTTFHHGGRVTNPETRSYILGKRGGASCYNAKKNVLVGGMVLPRKKKPYKGGRIKRRELKNNRSKGKRDIGRRMVRGDPY